MKTVTNKQIKENFLKDITLLTNKGYDLDITTIKEDSLRIDSYQVECKVFKVFRFEGSSGSQVETCLNKKDAEQIILYLKRSHAKLQTSFKVKYEITEDVHYLNSYESQYLSGRRKKPAKRKVA
tara:strand:- start:343 stop:714 length:372 start_codon:yes stop_codon:yes gene_type:complete